MIVVWYRVTDSILFVYYTQTLNYDILLLYFFKMFFHIMQVNNSATLWVWVCGEGETRHENFMSVQIVLNALAGYNRRHKDEVKVTTLVAPPSDCS